MSLKKNKSVLIFGKYPPPFGGVTVHVKRLTENLTKSGIKNKIFARFSDLFKFSIWHIHTNNSYKRLVLVIAGRLILRKTITTLHRDFKRDTGLKFKFNHISFFFSSAIIVLNRDSYIHYKKYFPHKIYLSTSFIAPSEFEFNEFPLRDEDIKILDRMKNSGLIHCTCAHHLRYIAGKDIYGIEEIINVFKNLFDQSLIISDPSGEYMKYFVEKQYPIPQNVHFITYQHSFLNVLIKADSYIRNTITDGDSLTVHEALYYGKEVFCTDVVNRPAGCNLYPLGQLGTTLANPHSKSKTYVKNDSTIQVIEIYEN